MKAFFRIALAILSLSLIESAKAGVIILPAGNYICENFVENSSGNTPAPCSGGDSQLSAFSAGIQGVSFYSSGTITVPVPAGANQQVVLSMVSGGALSGGSLDIGSALPTSRDYTVSSSDGVAIQFINLNFFVFDPGALGVPGLSGSRNVDQGNGPVASFIANSRRNHD
jgi:hypothetical protein